MTFRTWNLAYTYALYHSKTYHKRTMVFKDWDGLWSVQVTHRRGPKKA